MKSVTLFSLLFGAAFAFPQLKARAANCTGEFTPVTAAEAYAALNPGWNLGNSLDSIPNEDSWNNPPVTEDTFDDILNAGFKSVRIPVTWADHLFSESPDWTIDPDWMDRVETVVDQVLDRGFWAILNVHHDSWVWADLGAGADYAMIEEKFGALWTQIGTRFACKSSKLIFEPINEPAGDTEEAAAELNKLNDIFLERINKAGGFNSQRVVSLTGLGHDSIKTSQWFERGESYPDQPWGLQFHYYSPYDFVFGAWGKTIWGSDDDKALMDLDFELFRNNFTDIPVVIGEWQPTVAHTETSGRWKYYDHFIRTCNKYGFSSIVWDNGLDLLDRDARGWFDPVAVDILFNAVEDTSNTLPGSTTDPAAETQSSSAYLFHRVGDPVEAQSVTYLLNGNTLTNITDSTGSPLDASLYTMSSDTLTFMAEYLDTLIPSADEPAGTKETLTVSFSSGASLTLQIVQYSTPTLDSTSYPVQDTDLFIPVTWAGLARIAAVKALKADGTYLADDWTEYMGPLQQARWTYGNYEWDAESFILRQSGLEVIKAAGQDVTLTLEFYPRSVGENAVEVTITQ